MRICIATENEGKLEEFRSILGETPFDLVTARSMGMNLEVDETGSTYKENAALKAHAYANATGLPALADDTGLEVQALHGAPGLFSKRYLPEGTATDADRRAYLLANLQNHPKPWKARFTCVVCIALPDGSEWFTSGECKGEIIPTESGEYGFGYDRIFRLAGMGKTMADLTMTEKNIYSHRARAVKAAIPILYRLAELPQWRG
jgi:XTP/dITP diphosphohydrolase